MPTLKEIALEELRKEDERTKIEALKVDLRQKRESLLYRFWFNLRYKKPTIKWEYR